jgi:hypothetical protein
VTDGSGLAMSNSELTTWQHCKRKWMLKYYKHLSVKPENESSTGVMYLGTRIHVALEYMYGWGADPFQVLSIIYKHEKQYQSPEVVEELTKEHQLAVKMIEGYLEWVEETGADEDLEVVSTERDVAVEGPHGVTLRARLDMRVRKVSTGTIRFIDHKTVADFNGKLETLEKDPQMRFYTLIDKLEALQGGREERSEGGVWNMFKRSKRTARAKPPFNERVDTNYNDEVLRSVYLKIHAVIGEIVEARLRLDAGDDHRFVAYPNPGPDCSWKCEFKAMCPLMDDGSRWQDMAVGEFTVADPYAYYLPSEIPELVQLRDKKSAA